MLLCGALLANLEPAALAHALRRLGLPAKLAHALFFCVRYLETLHVEYHRLRNAMKLRAFRARLDRHSLRSLGHLVGMLFVRSVDRSDRILEAMKCRGFDGRFTSLDAFAAGRRDAAFALAAVLAAGAIAWVEWGP
jgi:cobalt/nickel transport system permease protein